MNPNHNQFRLPNTGSGYYPTYPQPQVPQYSVYPQYPPPQQIPAQQTQQLPPQQPVQSQFPIQATRTGRSDKWVLEVNHNATKDEDDLELTTSKLSHPSVERNNSFTTKKRPSISKLEDNSKKNIELADVKISERKMKTESPIDIGNGDVRIVDESKTYHKASDSNVSNVLTNRSSKTQSVSQDDDGIQMLKSVEAKLSAADVKRAANVEDESSKSMRPAVRAMMKNFHDTRDGSGWARHRLAKFKRWLQDGTLFKVILIVILINVIIAL
jgi:hypothetical protein